MSLQKEDVYETEDLPEVDQYVRQEEAYESEDVQKIHIDVDSALKRFQGRLLDANTVDFSDSIDRRRRVGYGSGAYVLEVVGPESGESETLRQKFSRLSFELNDLLETLQKQEKEGGREGSEGIDYNDVVSMLATLKACQAGSKPTCNVVPKEPSLRAPSQTILDENRFLNLEERLRRVEVFVGGADAADDFSKTEARTGLAEIMEDLRMRVQMLNPSNADGIHARLNQVLAKLREVDERKRDKVDSEFEQKVDSLYTLMMKWDEVCTNLPSVVQRVCDLNRLHEQAQLFNKNLSELVGVRAQLLKLIDGERLTVLDFKQQMAEAIGKVSVDIDKLNSRLEKLKS
ncbi:unnamed protein product [Enterobius vermicularis]|uniref:Dynactin subunit 2 n=1 Tax=Enterobius vermicularis TaxID=51028 RepID=A0A158Q9X2_ENTVE|nr:unnamed protein product [Enterobius vermicularis]